MIAYERNLETIMEKLENIIFESLSIDSEIDTSLVNVALIFDKNGNMIPCVNAEENKDSYAANIKKLVEDHQAEYVIVIQDSWVATVPSYNDKKISSIRNNVDKEECIIFCGKAKNGYSITCIYPYERGEYKNSLIFKEKISVEEATYSRILNGIFIPNSLN